MESKKIVFVGIDGAGKSSLIAFLKEKLQNQGKSVKIVFMGWRNLENPLLKIFVKEGSILKGDDKIKRFRERSWSFYIAYYLEMYYRYFKVLFSNEDFILIDRYFYDEIVFSKGFKFKILSFFAPKPDLCVILKADSKTLKKRGENFSRNRLEYFYSKIEKVENLCKTLKINSAKSRDRIFKELKKELNYRDF